MFHKDEAVHIDVFQKGWLETFLSQYVNRRAESGRFMHALGQYMVGSNDLASSSTQFIRCNMDEISNERGLERIQNVE